MLVSRDHQQRLIADYDKRIAGFAAQFQKKGWASLSDAKPVSYGFLCKHADVPAAMIDAPIR